MEVLEEFYGRGNASDFWNSTDPLLQEKREKFCEILFYMNSYNRRDNNWIQFIDIQFKEQYSNLVTSIKQKENSPLDSSVLVDKVDDLSELIQKYMDDLTLYIMPAGEAFLDFIVPSFEFFSVRYCSEYLPLFAAIPTPEELEQDVNKENDCIRILQTVTEYAKQCMDNLLSTDSFDFPLATESGHVYHVERIINHHTNYINAFIQHVEDHYLDEKSDLFKNKKHLFLPQYHRMISVARKCRDAYFDYSHRIEKWKKQIN